jgi:hypothetical protein
MKHSQLCFDNLQEAKHKWAAEDETDLSQLSATEREHLRDARRQLDNRPYHWFEEQYKLSRQYNVLEMEQGGGKGAIVYHTSQNQSKGYFIPDGNKLNCPCYDCHAMQNICRRLQAKRIASGQNPFDKSIVGGRHLFIGVLPTVRCLPAGINENGSFPCNDEAVTANSGTELVDGDVPFATVFSSPSKNDDGVKHRHIAAAHRAATRNAPNVNYKHLVEAGTKLASEVSGHSNEELNTIYSVLTNLREMVHDQDYSSDKYVGTVIEPIAAWLASLCQGMAIKEHTGGMKKKAGQRVGPCAKHRLGSERSAVNRLPYKSRFCGGSGTGAKYHSSSSSCPVK